MVPVSEDSLPILYARGTDGELQHIDSVANGLECGCTCPNPKCNQPMIARNNGKKRIHHFAHKVPDSQQGVPWGGLRGKVLFNKALPLFQRKVPVFHLLWASGGEVKLL